MYEDNISAVQPDLPQPPTRFSPAQKRWFISLLILLLIYIATILYVTNQTLTLNFSIINISTAEAGLVATGLSLLVSSLFYLRNKNQLGHFFEKQLGLAGWSLIFSYIIFNFLIAGADLSQASGLSAYFLSVVPFIITIFLFTLIGFGANTPQATLIEQKHWHALSATSMLAFTIITAYISVESVDSWLSWHQSNLGGLPPFGLLSLPFLILSVLFRGFIWYKFTVDARTPLAPAPKPIVIKDLQYDIPLPSVTIPVQPTILEPTPTPNITPQPTSLATPSVKSLLDIPTPPSPSTQENSLSASISNTSTQPPLKSSFKKKGRPTSKYKYNDSSETIKPSSKRTTINQSPKWLKSYKSETKLISAAKASPKLLEPKLKKLLSSQTKIKATAQPPKLPNITGFVPVTPITEVSKATPPASPTSSLTTQRPHINLSKFKLNIFKNSLPKLPPHPLINADFQLSTPPQHPTTEPTKPQPKPVENLAYEPDEKVDPQIQSLLASQPKPTTPQSTS